MLILDNREGTAGTAGVGTTGTSSSSIASSPKSEDPVAGLGVTNDEKGRIPKKEEGTVCSADGTVGCLGRVLEVA